MANQKRLDPVFESDRGKGSTPPESGPESNNVAGRPPTEHPRTAFHEPAETDADERAPVSREQALEEGGSFDAVTPDSY